MIRSCAWRFAPRVLPLLSGSRSNHATACTHDTPEVAFPSDWHTAKPYETIPGPTPLPIIGDAWRLIGKLDFLDITQDLHKQYGPIVRMQKLLPLGDMVFFMDAHDIETILRNEGPWPYRDGFASSVYYRHTVRKDVFGDTLGLVNGQNEDWGSFRSVVNPIMMQPRTTHQYIPQINEIADEMMVRIEQLRSDNDQHETPANFIDELNKWAFESITAIALDTRLGCLLDPPSEKSQQAISHIIELMNLILWLEFMPFAKLHRKYNTKYWRRFISCQDFFTNMCLELIEEASQRIQNDPNYAAKPEHEKSVFEKLVAKDRKIAIVMILDMLGAGVDTTAKATGAALYFLAKNPQAQNTLRAELQQLLPNKDTPLTKSILDEAKYLRACIKETLRFAPIGIGNMRRCTQPTVVGGYRIPPGVIFSMANLYISTRTQHFRNEEQFIPERWLRDADCEHNNVTDKVHPFVSLPFGFGARSCIGKRMANMEMEVLIAKIVRNYIMEWKHRDMRFKQGLVYGVADPLKITLTNVPN